MNRRYLTTLLLTSGLLLGAHALFCWWVDPYEIYKEVQLKPTRAYPVDLLRYLRLTKAYQLERLKPDVVIFGTSRAATLPPEIAAGQQQTAYNAALPGLTPYEMWSYFRHVVALGSPRRIVIALDYEAFLNDNEQNRTDFFERRMAKSTADAAPLPTLFRHYLDYQTTLFSLAATRLSLGALLGTDLGGILFYSDGTWLENPDYKRIRLVGKPGYEFIIKQYFQLLSDKRHDYALDYLQKIIDECHRLDIDAILFIAPAHNTLATVYQRTHHFTNREQWQRDIAQLLEQRAATLHKPAFPLWGFEDNAVSAEQVYANDDPSGWYRDGLHISAAYGRAMLEEMATPAAEPRYGRQLTHQNIDDYLNRTRQGLADYQRLNTDTMDWLGALIGDRRPNIAMRREATNGGSGR